MVKWTWRDVAGIASGLIQRHPGLDPLSVTNEQLRDLVVGLADFDDDPSAGTPEVLEEIQGAWYDAFEN